MKKVKILGIIIALTALLISYFITIDGLSRSAVRTLGVLVAALSLLIFESLNVCVTCMLSCAMLFAFGCVDSITTAFSGFSNHILYFTTASFGISLAFQKSALSKKLISVLLVSNAVSPERLGVKRIIFIFMLCAAALSAIMSNVAAVVIFIPFARTFLGYYGSQKDRMQTGRCMMICLAVSSLIGGMITPAGSSMNLICLDMLERYAGVKVRFIDWILAGLPLAAVMLVIAFLVITAVHRPVQPSKEELQSYLNDIGDTAHCGHMSAMDIYIGVLIFGIVLTWILSSWFPGINITVTAITGLALMFLPGFSVMSWEEFASSISWPTFFVAGSLISVAGAAVSTGLSAYAAERLFSYGSGFPVFAVVAQVAAVTFLFMAVLPSAPAVITVLSPVIIHYAASCGSDPVMLLMASALCVSNIYLFPLDAPLVVAYDQKMFGMFDMPKATIWLQFIMILIVSLWMPFISGLLFTP